MPLLIVIISCAVVFLYYAKKLRRSHPLPPGPPGDPFIGHVRNMPPDGLQDFLYELGKIYGDVIYLHIFGRPIIVLNSEEASVELLDKRGAIYSDRPRFIIHEIMGWRNALSLLEYGKRFQKHRRLFQQYLNKSIIADYQPIQTRETRILLQKLMSSDVDWHGHLQWFATAIMIRIAFGHQMTNENDPYVSLIRDASYTLTNAGPPGNTPIDFFPFLQYFPSWFPGTYFASFARQHRHVVDTLHQYPYDCVKKDMAEGKAKHCFIAHELEVLETDGLGDEEDIEDIQKAAAAMYVGGAETTSSTMAFFILAMVLYPDVQERAQKELDTVVGSARLPDFSDRDSLPYAECVLQETLRWHGAVPLGIPHRLSEDDIYKGMFVPKGSLVIANTRGLTLDERIYKNPVIFNPSRYLPKPEGDAEPFPNGPFGFGRRICPGRHLADASLWIAMTSILATLKISKVIGADGKEVTPDESITTGISSQPKPFRCRVQPRNERAKDLVINADISDYY